MPELDSANASGKPSAGLQGGTLNVRLPEVS